MKKSRIFVIVCTCLIAASFNVNAVLVSQTLNNVSILGATYDVTFLQDDASTETNSYDAILPSITFTTQESATAAVNAILAATSSGYDYTPGNVSDVLGENGFRVPYNVSELDYDYMVGREIEGSQSLLGPFSVSRDFQNVYSFATFEVSQVPLPAAVWLFGSGLLGMIGIPRHKKSA